MKKSQDKNQKRADELSQQLQQIILKVYVHTFELSGVRSVIKKGKDDYFFANDYTTNQQVDKQLSQMARQMNVLLLNGIRGEWVRGEDSIQRQVSSSLQAQATLTSRKNAADAFYNERRGGLSISERVWNLSKNAKKEIEIILQNGIKEGKSAAEISNSLKGYLDKPESLFRRVKNKETGELELSKAAQKYHPGQGVYRSAYKNAMRLARTEIKAAYHEAQWNAAQNNPLIVGWKIVLSNNHTTLRNGKPVPFRDICDEFVGEYPKSFKFHGWHPQCRCQMLPILARKEERKDLYRKVFDGKKKQWKPQQVKNVPEGFNEWIKKNAHRQTGWATTPYFIRDNFVDGQLSKGLMSVLVNEMHKIDPIQQELDALQPQVTAIKQMCTEWGVDTNALDIAISSRKPNSIVSAIRTLKERVSELTGALKTYLEDATATVKEAKANNVDSSIVMSDLQAIQADKRNWIMAKVAIKQKLADLKAKILAARGGAHPAILKKYETNAEVDETFKKINTEMKPGERWFENGDLKLDVEKVAGNNGSTWMDGRVYLMRERLQYVKDALAKIGQGKVDTITSKEADAMATFWHEITHNRNVHGNMLLTRTQRAVMEMMNEFVARKTLPDFYAKLGVKDMPHKDFINSRDSTGYNCRVLGYDFVIQKLGLDKERVLASAKKNLFTLKYTEQETTAVQALLDGGLDKFKGANGKKIGKAQLGKIVVMCRKGYNTAIIENYLKEQGILVKD